MMNIMSSKQKSVESETLRNELENLQILSSNNQLEIFSYQEALRQNYAENQAMKKVIEELSINQLNEQLKNEMNVLKLERNQFFNEKMDMDEELSQVKEKYIVVLEEKNYLKEEKVNLEEEINKLEETLKEYKELIEICEEVFTGDFEGILKESLGIIIEKKTMKQKIHNIVKDCTSKLLGEDAY